MVGFGYDDSTSPGTIYLHDTWDYDSHTMLWGGDYPSGSEYDLVSVSIVHLALNGYNSAQTGGWDTGSTWVGGSVPGASDSATIQSGHTVTLTSNTQINHLAIEYDGTLVIPEGVTLNVEGAFSNNGKIQQTLTVPGGGSTTTEFLRITSTGGVDKYHGVDITPVTTAMGVTTVSIRGNHTGGCTTVMEDPLLYRCFDITPGSEVEATIKFWYDEDERNGQDADNLLLWHHEGGNTWSQELGTHTRSEPSDSDDYTKCLSGGGQECWLEVTEITDYSVFDIGSQAAGPTAVGVQSFASKVEPGFYVALIVGLSFVLLGAGGLIYQRKKI